jgi:CRISPR-associated endonuclease Csn1
MLEKLNNLAVGTNLRPLDEAERAAILDVLQGQFSMSWGGVRKALGPLYKRRGEAGLEKRLRFNLEDGGEKGLSGNVVEAKLAAVFGTGWAGQPHRDAIRRAVHERLWSADYDRVGQRVVIRSEAERREKRAEAARSLAADFALGEDHAKKLEGLSLPTGWEPYSARALEAFMPHLEAGVRFGALVNGPDWAQWRAETFPDRDQPTGEVHDRLPSPAVRAEQQRLATLRNPTVVRVQNELRKVVNNLISVYGKPDRIRVELAREVGKSKRERDEMTDAIRKQEKRRKDAMADLIGNGIVSPSRDDVEKWLLWTDSAKQCPYTGDHISFDALFRTNQYQVEHIWPRGRSNDDSYGNKVLCRRDVNLAKGDRIPFEYLGHDPQAWSALLLRLEKLAARGRAAGLSRGKIKRFLAKSIPDDFASRQLNDTGYAARQAIASLRRLWPDVGIEGAPVRVHAVTGRVTARLRKEWGLNNILSDDGEKTRADHRHHAVDALVVACAHPGLTQVLSRFWEQKDAPNAPKPHLPPPWPAIRVDAARHIESLVVSHRVCKKISGPLHKATAFGDTGVTRVNNGVDYRELVRRKPLEEMSGEDVKAIRDGGVRGTVAAWVAAHGGDAKKAFATFPQLGEGGPHIYKARLIERKRLEVMADTAHGYLELGLNHHIAIYQKAEGRIESEIVSLFCAARRLSMHEPVVRRDRKDGSRFVMSLSSGDSIQFTSGDYLGVWIVISIWADGRVEIKAANDAGTSGKKRTTLSPSKLLTHGRKISVDPIGRIRPAND